MLEKIKDSMQRLLIYCEKENYKGYDPYDGLNSRLVQKIPFISTNRIARLVWIQLFKRSPFNLRLATGVRKDYNPKALGLFLSGYCNLYNKTLKQEHFDKIIFFSAKLEEMASKEWSGACWGYNFDWQARAFFQPKNTPTIVPTTFISNALLDAYEITKDEKLLAIARSSCNFILKDINRTYDKNGNFAFSYSPLDKSVVYNASLLASHLLARVYSFTHEKELIEEAKKAINFCCDQQRSDGSWPYGISPIHQFIDNFHTGYNLGCIADYMNYSRDFSFKNQLEKGFDYYIHTFFTEKGIPKYYDNSIYPIDVHCSAQLVITLDKLNKFHEHKELLNKVMNWTIENMQSKKGYFYYQITKYYTFKIPYMRWSQAWMFYALSTYIKFDYFEQN